MSVDKNPLLLEDTEFQIEEIYQYFVVLFNDSIHEFQYVEDCLMKICFKTKREAKAITQEAHEKGKSICYMGSLEECETVAEKLLSAELTVELGR